MAAEPAEDPFRDHLFPHILRHMTDFDPSPETQGLALLDSILESLVLKGSKNLLDQALAIRLCSPGIENLYSEAEGVPSMENSKAKDSRDHPLGRRLALGRKRPLFHTQSDSSINSRIYDIVEPQEHFLVVDQMQSNPVSLPPGGEEELKKYRAQDPRHVEDVQSSMLYPADLNGSGMSGKPATPRASLQGHGCLENQGILHEENQEIWGFLEASQISPDMEQKRKSPPGEKNNKKLTLKRQPHSGGKNLEDAGLAWKSGVRQSTRRKSTPSKHRLNEGYIYGQIDDSKPTTPRASLQGHGCSENQSILHEENKEIRGFQEASQVSPEMEQKLKSPPSEKDNKKPTSKRLPHSEGKDTCLTWKSGVRQSTRRKSTPSKHRLNEGYIYGQIDDSKPTAPRASLQGLRCSENQSILHEENKEIWGFQDASQVSPDMEQKRNSPPSEKNNKKLTLKRLPHSEGKDTCLTWESGVRQSTRRKSTPLKHRLNEGYIYGQIDDRLLRAVGLKFTPPCDDGKKMKSLNKIM